MRQRIKELARGTYGIARTFWLFWALGSLAVYFINAAAFAVFCELDDFMWDPRPSVVCRLGLGVTFLMCALYYIPCALGLWRAARLYTGPRIWRAIAHLASIISWPWSAFLVLCSLSMVFL